MVDYSRENWDYILRFKYGVPYVYGITIGDQYGDAQDREFEVTDNCIEDFGVKEIVDDYGISIEFIGDDWDLVGEMYVRIPVNTNDPDCDALIKGIYQYMCYNFINTDRSASYKYDYEDKIDECEIHLENELYKIDMELKWNGCGVNSCLEICISSTTDDIRNYRAMNFWSSSQDSKFCDFIDRIIATKTKEKENNINLLGYMPVIPIK